MIIHDAKTKMKGMLVIDNMARGIGKGGCRMAPDVTLWDCFRLARTMTWKWAMADIFLGGAKAAIVADPNDPNKEEIIRAYVRAIKKFLPDEYVFGNDMGFAEREEGRLVIDKCRGCGICTCICPEGAIYLKREGYDQSSFCTTLAQ